MMAIRLYAQLFAHLFADFRLSIRYNACVPAPVAKCATSCTPLRKKLRTFCLKTA
jgi:hypothetical protein